MVAESGAWPPCRQRVSCFIGGSLARGAPIVLVSGCHFADCHYINAVHWTQKRVEKLWDELEKKGIRPERLQLEWISAAEGQKFATVMRSVEELRQQVTPEEIAHTVKVLADELKPAKTEVAAYPRGSSLRSHPPAAQVGR